MVLLSSFVEGIHCQSALLHYGLVARGYNKLVLH